MEVELMDDQFKPSEALEREHREIDEGLAAFHAGLEAGEWRHDAFNPAAKGLRRHIYLEEEFLFPELRAAGLLPPVMVMVQEHGEIWRALGAIEAAAKRRDLDGARKACASMLVTLEEHNAKEEQILYPASDELMSPEGASHLRGQMETSTLPAGWLCEALR
jgi:iron-sulfur cluster repair protein YtfE (RIC family)